MKEKIQNLIALSRKLSKEHKYDTAEYKAVFEKILSLSAESADLKSVYLRALPFGAILLA